MILGMPWWILFIVLLIFLSGYMAFRAMRAEKQLEQQFIEKEGNIYLRRMEEEKEKKTNDHREISG